MIDLFLKSRFEKKEKEKLPVAKEVIFKENLLVNLTF